MADEPRILQPIVVMPPPPDPEATYDDVEAARFIEDTTVVDDLTFEQWVAQRRPLPAAPNPEDVPDIEG